MADERRENEVVVPSGAHAFVLNTNNGMLQTNTGPQKITITGTEKTVLFDPTLPSRFKEVPPSLAIQTNKMVPKGSYAILKHPHKDLTFPREGKPDELLPGVLEVGKVVNLPGPMSFALWAGQEVEIVGGHRLKTNEYLIVAVVDEDAARKNWAKSTIAETAKTDAVKTETPGPGDETKSFLEVDPSALVIGQLLLIKGNVVSFYIPPTGVEVLKDADTGKYVRQALTLERLEYCLLVDEDGNKRYVRGPEVVFPEPTETFKLNDDTERKSRAYELNVNSGLQLKAISDYAKPAPVGVSKELLEEAGFHVGEDGKEVSNQEGEELFITGKVQAIYFPCIEQAILTYNSAGQKRRSRHHATPIPPGDAKYVRNRLTGEIRTVRGGDKGAMLLPDPRFEEIVQRILSDSECHRYYPGNQKVLEFNRALRARSDADDISAEEITRGGRTGHVQADALRGAMFAASSISRAGDVINRGQSYAPPPSIVDSKLQGVPKINPWTGYACQLVSAKGKRDVVVGPQIVNLDFDQRLEALFLSTETPKQHDKLKETSYLKLVNNVSDQFTVMTADLVPVKVRLKYLIRFDESAKDRWFNVDNYIQLLVDHFRSTIGNSSRSEATPDFYMKAATLLKEWVLGSEGSFSFAENGMTVYDLEIVDVKIMNTEIAAKMESAQLAALTAQLTIKELETKLFLTQRKEATDRQIATETFDTVEHKNLIQVKTVQIEHERDQKKEELLVLRETYKFLENKKMAEIRLAIQTVETDIDIKEWEPERQKEIHDLSRRCEILMKEAAAMETRTKAIQPELTAALTALAQTGQFEIAVKHLGNLAILHDMSIGGVVEQVFKGTPLENTMRNLATLGKGKLIDQPAAAS